MTAIRIEHSGDGTLAHGTSRDDKDATAALKGAGFRWSRNLDAWFLPRTWGEPTRMLRVREVASKLGDQVTVEVGDLAKSGTADERVQARIDRGQDRADHLDAKAERLAEESDGLLERSRALTANIPFGQPILVGHHSQRRHENTLNKSWNLLGKSVAATEEADRTAAAARSARYNAAHHDHPVRLARRLDRNEAELRRLQRSLDAADSAIYGTGEWVKRITAMVADLTATIERDKRIQAESGAASYSQATVKAGDQVTIRGTTHTVVKANPKKVVIQSHGLTLSYLWGEVTAHTPADPS